MDFTQIEKILKSLNGVSFIVNLKEKKILKAYRKGEMFLKDISYLEFISLVFKDLGYVFEKSPSEYIRMYEALDFSNSNILVPMKMEDGSISNVSIRKIILDDTYAVCLFLDTSKSQEVVGLLDSLTGAYQKNYVIDLVKRELTKPKPKPFTFIILDLDNFKTINDTLGHMYGDKVLILVTNLIKDELEGSIISRFGGDEFMIMLYGDQDYDAVWEKLHKLFMAMDKIRKENKVFSSVSFTAGVTRFPLDGDNYETLFEKADKALYRGKRKGKCCFIIYNDERHKDINLDLVRIEANEDMRRNDYSVTKAIEIAYQTLNQKAQPRVNIINLFKYLCNYFSLDRILFYHSPFPGTKYTYRFGYATGEYVQSSLDYIIKDEQEEFEWQSLEDTQGNCIMKKVSNIKDVFPKLYQKLEKENVQACLRFTLKFGDKILGYLRIDDTHTTVRMWQLENVELLQTIIHFLELYIYKSFEKEILEEFKTLDPLTGLINYDTFVTKADLLLTKNKKMVVTYFNLRHFKYINNNYGFRVGDLVIKNFAESLKEIYKTDNSLITRVTSDRFIVLAPYISKKDIDTKFNILKNKYQNFEYKIGSKLFVHIDAGVYITDGTLNNITIAMDRANLARRYAKELMDSNYVLYSNEISKGYQFEVELENHFNEALLTNEFEIYLQPKINIKTGELIGAEALSRWKYNGAYLKLDSFLPILEKTGKITDLDLHVFEEVCKLERRLLDSHIGNIPISVNLSKHEARLDEYVDKIVSLREKYQIPPNLIEVEVVESLFVKSEEKIIRIINRLKEHGYLISMDDFGSGYSNLSTLAKVDVDIVKIDSSMCKNIGTPKNNSILKASIDLFKELKLDIIAEGVESKEQAQTLLEMGCEKAQGFLYDKALPIDEFIEKYLEK